MRFPSFPALKTRSGIKCRNEKINVVMCFGLQHSSVFRNRSYQTNVVGMSTNGEYPWEEKKAHVWPDDQEDGETKLWGKGEKCLMTPPHRDLMENSRCDIERNVMDAESRKITGKHREVIFLPQISVC